MIVGGAGGNGVMLSPDGRVLEYYNAAGVSYGLQFGAESYSQALFLVTPEALKYLDSSAGWSVGTGPHVVVVDKGMGKDLSSTTLRPDVFAFIYGQHGLMGALGVQGQKITKLHPR
jgi:lipid-binding SYLF domain-containing protein